ncbi:hypothetical protein TNCV_2193261 [Trichonephila clavipes]|nr:hypothetical protein TNCV_2193261 [Trichonephila clavipes]
MVFHQTLFSSRSSMKAPSSSRSSKKWKSLGTTDYVEACGSPVDKVSGFGMHVMTSSPVPINTHRVGGNAR